MGDVGLFMGDVGLFMGDVGLFMGDAGYLRACWRTGPWTGRAGRSCRFASPALGFKV